jgi:hypothetical protein
VAPVTLLFPGGGRRPVGLVLPQGRFIGASLEVVVTPAGQDLVCGSMGRQPWFVELYGPAELPAADVIHRHGLYVPVNPDLTAAEVEEIASLVLAPGPGSVAEALPAGVA